MDLYTALRLFEEDIKKYCSNKNIPELYRSKKLDMYNAIIEYVSDIDMENEDLAYKLIKANKTNSDNVYKYESILLSIGIKYFYIKNLQFIPISHIEMLVEKSKNLGYSNRFTPDDLYLGSLYEHSEMINQNLEALLKNKTKFKSLSAQEIIDYIETIDHE